MRPEQIGTLLDGQIGENETVIDDIAAIRKQVKNMSRSALGVYRQEAGRWVDALLQPGGAGTLAQIAEVFGLAPVVSQEFKRDAAIDERLSNLVRQYGTADALEERLSDLNNDWDELEERERELSDLDAALSEDLREIDEFNRLSIERGMTAIEDDTLEFFQPRKGFEYLSALFSDRHALQGSEILADAEASGVDVQAAMKERAETREALLHVKDEAQRVQRGRDTVRSILGQMSNLQQKQPQVPLRQKLLGVLEDGASFVRMMKQTEKVVTPCLLEARLKMEALKRSEASVEKRERALRKENEQLRAARRRLRKAERDKARRDAELEMDAAGLARLLESVRQDALRDAKDIQNAGENIQASEPTKAYPPLEERVKAPAVSPQREPMDGYIAILLQTVTGVEAQDVISRELVAGIAVTKDTEEALKKKFNTPLYRVIQGDSASDPVEPYLKAALSA